MRRNALHGLQVAHAIPGRTRLKFGELKSQAHRQHTLKRTLASIPGVHQVDINTQTGSVILHHDKEAVHSMEFLGAVAAAFGIAELTGTDLSEWATLLRDVSSDTAIELLQNLQRAGAALDQRLAELTGGHLDSKTLLPGILLLLGLRSVLVSDVLAAPKWYEFFWFAFGAYYTLNKPENPGEAAT